MRFFNTCTSNGVGENNSVAVEYIQYFFSAQLRYNPQQGKRKKCIQRCRNGIQAAIICTLRKCRSMPSTQNVWISCACVDVDNESRPIFKSRAQH